ncbi:unnamed protein product, partial [Brassica napus]
MRLCSAFSIGQNPITHFFFTKIKKEPQKRVGLNRTKRYPPKKLLFLLFFFFFFLDKIDEMEEIGVNGKDKINKDDEF